MRWKYASCCLICLHPNAHSPSFFLSVYTQVHKHVWCEILKPNTHTHRQPCEIGWRKIYGKNQHIWELMLSQSDNLMNECKRKALHYIPTHGVSQCKQTFGRERESWEEDERDYRRGWLMYGQTTVEFPEALLLFAIYRKMFVRW
jgi:hypothetical protein